MTISMGLNSEISQNFNKLRDFVRERGGVQVDGKTSTDFNRIAEGIEAAYPDVWGRCYRRHINAPGNYRGFKAVACTFASAYIETEMMLRRKKLISNGWMIGNLLEEHDWPTYFVTAPLLQAMLRTHPPQGMTWADIPWPFDAVTFMIPRGILKDITGAPIYALGAFQVADANKPDQLPEWLKHLGAHTYARSGVFWLFEPAGLMLHDCTFPSTQSLEPDAEWIDKATAEQVDNGSAPAMVCSGDFASHMAGIVANILLVMQARPELVERGGRTGKRLASGVPAYGPTFIGRKYTTETRGPRLAGTTGHFTELRWVAGHLRNQAYGKGRTDRKLILIDPFLRYGAGLVREAVI